MDIKKQFTFSKKHIVLKIVLLAVVLIVLESVFLGPKIDKYKLKKTKIIGNAIVSSLKNYYSDQGRYPQTLQQLVPQYLAKVKEPTWGLGVWDYECRPEGKGYSLAVSANDDRYPILFRTDKDTSWYLDE